MPRTQRQSSARTKTGYTRSATIDEPISTSANPSDSTRSIKRVIHPADRSSLVLVLRRLAKLLLTLLISLPCVLVLTLTLPIYWLVRTLIRLTCRYHCTVTPCTCSYLSGGDLFWLSNSSLARYGNKNDERQNLQSQTTAPTAAAIFYLEGKLLCRSPWHSY